MKTQFSPFPFRPGDYVQFRATVAPGTPGQRLYSDYGRVVAPPDPTFGEFAANAFRSSLNTLCLSLTGKDLLPEPGPLVYVQTCTYDPYGQEKVGFTWAVEPHLVSFVYHQEVF